MAYGFLTFEQVCGHKECKKYVLRYFLFYLFLPNHKLFEEKQACNDREDNDGSKDCGRWKEREAGWRIKMKKKR